MVFIVKGTVVSSILIRLLFLFKNKCVWPPPIVNCDASIIDTEKIMYIYGVNNFKTTIKGHVSSFPSFDST